MRLKDKVILVTASTRGIGLAIVKKCAEEGARVYMAARNMEQAQEIALNHAGFTADQVTNLHGDFDVDDGVPEYEVGFFQDGWEYDYTIHADTGDILEYDKDND